MLTNNPSNSIHHTLLTLSKYLCCVLALLATPIIVNSADTLPPTLAFTADNDNLEKDQGTRIRWSSRRATSCIAIGGWTTSSDITDKHWVSSINQTTTYRLTCTGAGGSVTKSVTLKRDTDNDTESPQSSAPKLILTSDLSTLQKDQGTRIRWSASDATSCIATNGWTSKTGTVDKHWVSSIEQTTSYQLTCTGTGGSVTKSITLSRDTGNETEDPQSPAPKLTLTSDLSTLQKNQGTRIRWGASDATSCIAIGGWSSSTNTADNQWISSIDQTTSYQLICTGAGGSITKSITLSRDTGNETEDPQSPTPTLTLTSDFTSIDSNGSTTIRWSSNNTTGCNAQNSWSSKTDVTGKQYIGSIENTTTYTMTCIGDGGSVSKSVLVAIDSPAPTTGSVDLNWSAPVTNQDGSQLNDLAGYKVYYGTSQSNLNNVANIDAGLTSFVIENLAADTYYFSISAVDVAGNESTRSNIAAKVVN